MPSDLRLRLRRYSPAGVRGVVIDYSAMSVSMPSGDAFAIPSCQVSVRAYEGLAFPMLAGLEWSTGDPDQPVPGGLYLLSTDAHDAVDVAKVHSLSGVQFVPLMMGGAKVYAAPGGDAKKRVLSGTAGEIISDLVGEAQVRGWFPDLTLTFSDSDDSGTNAWDVTIDSFEVTVGVSVWSVLSSLTKMRTCEFTADFTAGVHVLNLWNPGHGSDLSGTVSIAPDATSIPVKQDYSNVATHLLAQLDDGTVVEHAVVGAPTTFGRVESWVGLGGITDPVYAAGLLASLDTGAATPAKELSITRQAIGSIKLPIRDYLSGDIVQYRADGGNWLNGRVIAITLNCEGTKVTVQETFGTIILDTATRIMGLVAESTGGIGNIGNTGGVTPPTPDVANPATPTGFTAVPAGYWDENGQTQGLVTFGWNPVTTSDTGGPILIEKYELLIRDTTLGLTDTYEVAAAFDNALILTTGFPTGSTWEAQVVAVSTGGGRSIPSTPDTFIIPAPTLGVVAPVAPVVVTGTGMAIITPVWEQDTMPSPTAMPEQVARLDVYASIDDGATGWVMIGSAMSDGDQVKYVTLPGDEWWFACKAVTSDEQETALSDSSSVLVTGVGVPDMSDQVTLILTGPLVETNPGVNLGVKVSAGGIVAYDTLGDVTFLVDAATGEVYFRDGLIDGSVIAAGTIQATAIEAGAAFVDLIQSISDQLDLSANASVQIVIGANLDPLQEQVDGIDTELGDQRVYFTFDSSGFTVSQPGDPMAFRVGAGEASILANGNVVSYWNESQLVVPSILIENGQIGNHLFTKDGSTGTVVKAVS